jgi:probable HAF family extracellular repeat protein
MVGLGDLAGGIFESVAYGVTDGGVVVGSSASTAGPEAFIWVGGTMYSLLDVLIANGLAAAVSGWTLSEARAISDDGLTIAGWGVNPGGAAEGWITTIAAVPEPSTGLLLALGLALLCPKTAQRRRAECTEQEQRPRATD